MVDISSLNLFSSNSDYVTYGDPRDAFTKEMTSWGLVINGGICLGILTRVAAEGDKGTKKSGWYIYHEMADEARLGSAIGVGVFGSWKGNPERIVWMSKQAHAMSADEQAAYAIKMAEMKAEQTNELLRIQEEGAASALAEWASAAVETGNHAYLVKKGVNGNGLRLRSNGQLIAPMYSPDGTLVSLQRIKSDGTKLFWPGGRTRSCYWWVGVQTPIIYVAEGVATAFSIYEATGCMVYIAYTASNLLDVVGMVVRKHENCTVIVAGDDDSETVGNPGRTKANAAADVHRCAVVFPAEGSGTDFNDMAQKEGLDAVRALLSGLDKVETLPVILPKDGDIPLCIINPPGILGEIAAYYNATARSPQPIFAVQTALVVGSLLCGRTFKTNKNNYSALFFINVAKSGTGKEHAQTVAERVVEAAGLGYLIAGAGYTSAGAVMSRLLSKPRHLTIMDEFGRYLEAAKNRGNSAFTEANTQLMQAITKCHAVHRPPDYSTMTLKEDQKKALENRRVYRPSITLLAMTTPEKFVDNLSVSLVKDGFLNRFIIAISETERGIKNVPDDVEVPSGIIEWASILNERARMVNRVETALEQPEAIELVLTDEALAAYREYDNACVNMANKMEEMRMEELPSRSAEFALRIALICALARDPLGVVVNAEDVEWGIAYVDYHLQKTFTLFKQNISNSFHEGDKKEVLSALRKLGERGITKGDMYKRPPFSKHKPRDLKDILDALEDAELVHKEALIQSGPGRPAIRYVARG